MSSVFISYSSRDRSTAELLAEQLRAAGFEALFLDASRRDGLVVGDEWERELYRHLRTARAVVALASAESMKSQWCFAEVAHARALGKPVFPMRLDETPFHSLLSQLQAADYFPTSNRDAALERLCDGLRKAGVQRGAWNRERPPFPGLLAFEADDEAVFFGRDRSVTQVLSELRQLRMRDETRWLVLLGASGSGKSSLLRAGVLPQLRRDRASWLPVGPLKPEGEPVERFARSLSDAFAGVGLVRAWDVVRTLLLEGTAQQRADLLRELRFASGCEDARVVVLVDQLEEALTPHTNSLVSDGGATLLSILSELASDANPQCLVLATLRSDFLGAFQEHPAARSVRTRKLVVEPLLLDDIPLVIEGPAQLAGVALGEGLVDAIVRDAAT